MKEIVYIKINHKKQIEYNVYIEKEMEIRITTNDIIRIERIGK